jgi:hypothetical protein
MKAHVKLEKERMSEREVRDSIDRAAARARVLEQKKGNGDRSQDELRRKMTENAERDRREGKI